MKSKILAPAIRTLPWAGIVLSAAFGALFNPYALAQGTQVNVDNATPAGTTAALDAAATSASRIASPSATSSTTGGSTESPLATLKRVEVTGSLIRSSDRIGFNQVQTVTAKDIRDSGANSVSAFLRSTTANSADSWSEATNNNFAAGASGIALRGLSEKYTLVLIDGQRVAPFAFFSNGVDAFFDLNTLPLSAISRIDIVKTGAVSQYGSDAIAGVVNIITKHDFQGLQLDSSYGGSIDGRGGNGTAKFSALGGFGNLTSDGYNVTASASFARDNGSTLADRDSTSPMDFTNRPGGMSLLAPSYWTNPLTGNPQALGSCPYGSSVKPASSNFTSVFYGQTNGTVCGLYTGNGFSIEPWSQRLSAKVDAQFRINETTTAFADLWESNNTSVQGSGVSNNTVGGTNSSLVYNPATKQFSLFNNIVPASNPYNPYGVATPLIYTFPRAVAETTDANYWRAATGLKGSVTLPDGEWNWATTYTHSQSDVSNTYSNQLNVSALNNIYQNGTYDFANPSATPNGLNGLYMNANNIGVSKLDTLDATISTPTLLHLPTGDVGFGLGAEFFHQSESLAQGAASASGLVLTPYEEEVSGQRNVAAAYYQLDIPIIRTLTFSQSGRYDHYSDVGGAFSPRFALRWQPVKELTAYASYDRGFRAPTFVEDSTSQNMALVINQSGAVTSLTSGNPNLHPERTKNYNIGFELSPVPTTEVGVDWYRIHVSNAIGIDQPSSTVNYPGSTIPEYETFQYQNLGDLDTSGFETTFRESLPTAVGTFTLSGDWAYVDTFKFQLGGQTVNSAGNNLSFNEPFGGSFPRWKGNTTLSWAWHAWNAALSWQYTGPYTQTFTFIPTPTPQAGSVGSYSQFNLMVTYTGFRHWTIYGGMNNIFNRAPPFDAVGQDGPFWQQGYDTSLYSYVGRFAQIGATYKF
ncbi:TonB-dependent receptor [Paraburkholderia megapolitana]|uniref:TonB-dependent receptor n=1 Tax=Paraburkholderia megapolitana TaxID=420953 RepID=UPI000B8331A5|nr:TonB-dependent receptor [Paraburkholderia megapolitana]QDQ82280.1 TonB-dependent receptor [Paraburkholderia megapolitana]